jgi:glycosyltransferase involved in cell wall biosynthesis
MSVRRRVLVVNGEVIAERMAGPAIRAYHLATALSDEHEVVLLGARGSRLAASPVTVVDESGLAEFGAWAEIVVAQGDLLSRADVLTAPDKFVVVDLYDPFHLEALERTRALEDRRRRSELEAAFRTIASQILRGDCFLCASERQRDFWLGHLAAMGRVNEQTYDSDPTMRNLIDVVPFGVDDEAPSHGRTVLRGVVPGIAPDDRILYWGGGIYEWFDPLTLVRAVEELRHDVPNVRLFFAGFRHPNPSVGVTPMAQRTRVEADRLGLTGRNVFFNDWVEFSQRADYLLEADIGVSTHVDHLETAFSFRTRILDYLWASLPVVTTAGDALAAIIDDYAAGMTVPPGDVGALRATLHKLLDDDALRMRAAGRAGEAAAALRWSETTQPLLRFCRAPVHAPDPMDGRVSSSLPASRPRPPATRQAAQAMRYLREGRYSELWSGLRNRLTRRDAR